MLSIDACDAHNSQLPPAPHLWLPFEHLPQTIPLPTMHGMPASSQLRHARDQARPPGAVQVCLFLAASS